NLADQPLRRERRDNATCCAIIGGNDRVNVVVIGSKDLLHVGLSDFGLPAVGVLLSNNLDLAGVDLGLEDLNLPAVDEVADVHRRTALDVDVVAGRPDGETAAGLDAADFGVVEAQIEYAGDFDLDVVAD